jgi:flagellar biosynthesis protein FlhF
MRLKLFSAPNMNAAMAQIRAERGHDAVILSTRQMADGVEVRAAVERAPQSRLGAPMFQTARSQPQASLPMAGRLREQVRDTLVWHGASTALADMLGTSAVNLAGGGADPATGLGVALETVLGFQPIPAHLDRSLLLVGTAGAGRTATAAKLIVRTLAAGSIADAVAADFDATGGGARLAAFLERREAEVACAETPQTLERLLAERRRIGRPCIIDAPPINPWDGEDVDRLRTLVELTGAEPVLVMAADGNPAEQEEVARIFAQTGVRRAIITKLDLVRRRAGAVAAVAGARLGLAHLAMTPFIGGGLIPATPARLSRLFFDTAPSQESLRGAA